MSKWSTACPTSGSGCFKSEEESLGHAIHSDLKRRLRKLVVAPSVADWRGQAELSRVERLVSGDSPDGEAMLGPPARKSEGGSMRGLLEIIDAIPTIAWCARPDGSSEFLNRGWQDYTGLAPLEGLGWKWKEAIHPEDLSKLMAKWETLLANGEPGTSEGRLRRFDGVYRWFLIRYNPTRDEQGRLVQWQVTGTDIDDLKRAEAKLRQDEEELRRITDLISQQIIVLSPEGKALYANRPSLEYTGLSLDEMQADDWRERIFHPEDIQRLREERRKALLSNIPFENEQRARGKDGRYRWMLIRYKPFLDESGKAIRWYASGTDIEDRKQAEEQLHKENLALREEINHISMFEEIVGSSEALQRVLRQLTKVAPSDSTVLITGESGTGKELIARAIHNRSKRAGRPFIGVNCAAIPGSLVASELFGHEKGAFTGATQRRLGRFEAANGGTIFLDEVGDLPADIQIALLRVLQEREIERVGSNTPIPVDVRVLAATHRDLANLASEGKFRQDLLYRLNVVPIAMPSLRERLSDIPLLVEYFIARFGKQAAKKFRRIDKKTLQLLQAYEWPGNVRELQNVIERAVILSDSDTFAVDETWLKGKPSETPRSTPDLTGALLKQEREMIEAALAESSGRISGPAGAAARLGLPSRTLDSKIKRLGINKHQFKVRS